MLEVPESIITYILNFMLESRSLAYVLVSKEGNPSTWGGKLATYGIINLCQDENVGEQILFLEGLLPLDDSPLFLPQVQPEEGICADVHIFPSSEGDWVLLLDATLDQKQLSLIQQLAHDSILFREKVIKILKE
ncbi:hypothetical protein [Calothrix sp. PCC 6303]|uniref:hypothetical protein n=1 Tax=Calothrix sp. PCC 6303 TaxID=1170562 RepID=UPI0002A03054|nr:hypothetical protein [Calothrix sp. PCC 6303]AFZ00388.1 hypothetical protein Cal6303_1328 [Calothrix sp. PCC 6303]